MRPCTRCKQIHPADETRCSIESGAPSRQTAALPTGVMPIVRQPKPRDDGRGAIGKTLGSYKLLEVIGAGGMGHVYMAEHVKLGRKVAIKLLRTEYAVKRDSVMRFFQEAKAVNKIRHRNIVDVTDFMELPDGQAFIIMELLEGTSLGRIYRAGESLSVAHLLAVLVQVCDALAAAHAVGIIHRDLKPDNIFVVENQVTGVPLAKLLDFGIAKLIANEYDADDETWRTSHNQFLGTPAFMSPEQAICDVLDGRSDVYSLGAIMYELFCGQPLFVGKSFGDYVLQHKNRPPTPPAHTPKGAFLPPGISSIILRCLAKQPSERYATAAALRKDLLEVLQDLESKVARLASLTPEGAAEATGVDLELGMDELEPEPELEAPPTPLAWEMDRPSTGLTLRRSRLGWGIAAALAGVVALGVGAFGLSGSRDDAPETAQATSTPEPLPEPAAPPAVAAAPAPAPATKAAPAPAKEKPAPAPVVATTPPARPARRIATAEAVRPSPPPRPSKTRRGAKKPRVRVALESPPPAPEVEAAPPPPAPAPAPKPPADIGREETMNPFGGR